MRFEELNEQQQARVCELYRDSIDEWYEETLDEAISILNSATGLNVDMDEVGFSLGEETATATIVSQYIYADAFDVFCGGLQQFVEKVISATDVAQMEPTDVETVQSALFDAIDGRAGIHGEITNTGADLAFDDDDLLDPLAALVDDGTLTDDQLEQVYEAFDEQAVAMCDKLGDVGVKSMKTMYAMLDEAWDNEMSDEAVARIAQENNWDWTEEEAEALLAEEEEEEELEEEELDEDDVWSDDPSVYANRRGRHVVARR